MNLEIRKGSKAGERKLGMNDITKRAQIKNGSSTEPWETPVFRIQRNNETSVKQVEKEQSIKRENQEHEIFSKQSKENVSRKTDCQLCQMLLVDQTKQELLTTAVRNTKVIDNFGEKSFQ